MIRVAITLITLITGFAQASEPKKCLNEQLRKMSHFGHLEAEAGYPPRILSGSIKIEKTESTFEVEDVENGFFFFANLFNGNLSISTQLSRPHQQLRSHLRGALLYDQMMAHFTPERIRVINGVWSQGDNYETFLRAVAEGQSQEGAVRETWSAKRAATYGFTRISQIHLNKNADGSIHSVTVKFSRP